MYKKVVAHFIRKNTQLRSSFIQNQILNHIEYKPVIIYRYHSDKLDGGFAEFNENNIPTLNLSEGKKIDVNFRYLKKLSKKDLKKVLKFLDENNVNILHFHYGTDACIYTDVMKYSGRLSVVSFYGYDAFSFKKSFLGYGSYLLKHKLFPYSTKILAMSEEMRKDLISIGCPYDKILVHYHGIPTQRFLLKRNYFIKSEKIVLLNISALDPVKGHIFVLKALKKLLINGFKNFELRIIGNGWFRKNLERFVKKNNLDSYVIFKGSYSYGSEKILQEIKNAHIFVHPSIITKEDKEGIPGAIVEAMASGLPIISTYHGGIPYIIKNEETGLLVNEWDIDALAKAILELSKDSLKRERLGQAAQNFALNHLDLFKKEKELEDIYNSLIEKK